MAGIEIVAYGVVVGRGGDDYEIGIAVCCSTVGGGGEVEVFFGKVFFDILVLNWRDTAIDAVYFFGYDIDCGHVVVLRQQGRNRQAYVTRACNGYIIFSFFHRTKVHKKTV